MKHNNAPTLPLKEHITIVNTINICCKARLSSPLLVSEKFSSEMMMSLGSNGGWQTTTAAHGSSDALTKNAP